MAKKNVSAQPAVAAPSDPPVVLSSPNGRAAEVAAMLRPGVWLCGLTRGQFSLLDLVRALLAVTGPADVVISTWSTGIRDMDAARWLVDAGEMKSLRLLTDRSFPSRQPKYAARLTSLFGPEAIIVSRVHAKIATIRNDRWNLAVRSSMNLNRNPRFEQFDVNDSPEACDFLGGWVDELAASMGGVGLQFEESACQAAFMAALRDGVSASEAVAEMLGETPEETAAREAGEVQAAAKEGGRLIRLASVGDTPANHGGGALSEMGEDALLCWELDRLSEAVTEGDAGSVAYVHALRAIRETHQQLVMLRKAQPAPEAALTLTQIAKRLAAEVADVPDVLLEPCVVEWARRKGYVIAADDRGRPQLQRRAG